MTRQDMHNSFRLNYSKINANKPKSFLPEEVDVLLNWAYDAFVQLHIKPKRTNPENFTSTQLSLDDVQTLLKFDSTDGTLKLVFLDKNTVSINMPADYLHLVDDSSDTNVTCKVMNKAPNRLFSSDIISTVISSYLYKPCLISPVSELMNNVLYVYKTNDFNITAVYIKYLRKYNAISSSADCDLPIHTHNTIVDNAVNKAKAIINANNYEKFINESNKN